MVHIDITVNDVKDSINYDDLIRLFYSDPRIFTKGLLQDSTINTVLSELIHLAFRKGVRATLDHISKRFNKSK